EDVISRSAVEREFLAGDQVSGGVDLLHADFVVDLGDVTACSGPAEGVFDCELLSGVGLGIRRRRGPYLIHHLEIRAGSENGGGCAPGIKFHARGRERNYVRETRI